MGALSQRGDMGLQAAAKAAEIKAQRGLLLFLLRRRHSEYCQRTGEKGGITAAISTKDALKMYSDVICIDALA